LFCIFVTHFSSLSLSLSLSLYPVSSISHFRSVCLTSDALNGAFLSTSCLLDLETYNRQANKETSQT
jgi:hypothetical protein